MRIKIHTTYHKPLDRYEDVLKLYGFEKIEKSCNEGYIMLETANDVFELRKKLDQELVITTDGNDDDEIEIYDDYRE